MSQFEVVIGLEIHTQLKTQTKMFCRCSNNSFGKEPNTNICPICMGYPGTLPALNEQAIKLGIKAALALNCEIQLYNRFDRKNYFYPDLPKGYQISQYDKPLALNGWIVINLDGKTKKVGITRAHLEEDAGKLIHEADASLCDFNRSGVPLLEIVSAPEIYSVAEASAYAKEIQRILRFVQASDSDMEKGHLRFDLNISLKKKGATELGTKVEVKNLNSFKSLENAIRSEIVRQTEALEQGEKIGQETRSFDVATGETASRRSKEGAADYRYFPEPDLPPLDLKPSIIEEIKAGLPELPEAKRVRFKKEYALSTEKIEYFIEDTELADFFEALVKKTGEPQLSANWLLSTLLNYLKKDKIRVSQLKFSVVELSDLIILVKEGKLSNALAKEVFQEMYAQGSKPGEVVAKKGLAQLTNSVDLKAVCEKAVKNNPTALVDLQKGKDRAWGFLVGQIMKETKGRADPKIINKILKEIIKL